jgi:hypothetical protein
MPESPRANGRDDILQLPEPSHPLAAPVEATIDMILASSAEMLPVWNADPANEERRLARKSRERFSLVQPPVR